MKNRTQEAGVTLVELMVAVAIIGVGILGSIAAYGVIQRANQSSKAGTLAANLTQQQMQIIMQKTYFEILPTTGTAYNTSVSPSIPYDPYYFAPISILEGGNWYTVLTYVQVVQQVNGVIQTLPPDTPDTGMRQITISAVWQTAGNTYSTSIQNIINNPNTVMSDVVLNGQVTDALTSNPIPSALVDVAENVGWRDTTNATGNYLIHLSPGSFDLEASAQGYYLQRVTISVAPNNTTTQNFVLTPISTGTIQGTAWLDNHLVISQVVADTGSVNDLEYVELYNPTTYSIYIGDQNNNGYHGAPSVVPIVWDQNNNPTVRHLVYVSSAVPANSFYLIANTGIPSGTATSCSTMTISGTVYQPDACWMLAPYPDHAIECGGSTWSGSCPNAGGFSLGSINSYTGNLNFNSANWPAASIDSMGWSDTSNGYSAPSSAVEGTGLVTTSGLQPAQQFVRKTDTGTVNTSFGRAYNANINLTDFNYYTSFLIMPNYSGVALPPLTGTPAVGAIASATDGLSSPSSATLVGNPPYAQFVVTRVATGTWTVFVDSGASTIEIDTITVTTNTITMVPNSGTSPTWQTVGANDAILSNIGVVGTISGWVTDLYGSIISPSVVVSVGGTNTTVGATGHYALRLATGTYDVTANPYPGNAAYASQTIPGVVITLGDVTDNQNFQLAEGGRINGWVTRDGINPLPGVTVVALDPNGDADDTEVSASNGYFTLINLTTQTYTVQTVLDPKETSTPAFSSTTVTAGSLIWSSTFTVIGAMGTVTGTVTTGGSPIQTGVLVVISTMSVSAGGPPKLNTSALTGPTYYADSSHEDGTYSVFVRGSTTTVYNVAAYYEHLNANQIPVISTSTHTGVTVTAGQTTSGVNFAW